MMDYIAIQAVPVSKKTVAIECSECGPLCLCLYEEARKWCLKHKATHNETGAPV